MQVTKGTRRIKASVITYHNYHFNANDYTCFSPTIAVFYNEMQQKNKTILRNFMNLYQYNRTPTIS